ncbi:MAG: radical SAM protein [Bacillota bacterium]
MLYVTRYLLTYPVEAGLSLLFNTLTGAVDSVPDRLARLLQPSSCIHPDQLTPDEIDLLTSRGYLSTDCDERERVVGWFADFKERMKSLWFIVCPTYTCNLRCPYCYEDIESRRSKTALSPEAMDHMFRAMDRLVTELGAAAVNLELFGGEPFLRAHRQLVEAILLRSAERSWPVSGISNGTQIDSYFDLFERLGENLWQIQITMDGAEEFHNQLRIYPSGRGSYEEICRNVSGLLQRGIPVLLRINAGPDNAGSLPRLFSAFEEMGWTQYEQFQCQIAPINDHGCTGCVPNYQPEFKLLRTLYDLFDDWEAARVRYHLNLGYDMERRTRLLRKALHGQESAIMNGLDLSGCSASKHHYVIFGAEGHIYACPETVGIADVAIGRYFPDFQLDMSRWSKWEVNISNTAKCLNCSIAPVCGGACPWHGFNSSSFDAYQPHCNYARQTIDTYLDLNRSQILKLLDSAG